MRDQNTSGNLSVNEVKYHISIKEMLAATFALKSFVEEFSNVSIKQIREWCKGRNISYSLLTLIQKEILQIDP